MKVAGIDVGWHGGISILKVDNDNTVVVNSYYPMPVIVNKIKSRSRKTKKVKVKVKYELDIKSIYDIIKDVDVLVIEDVTAMPFDGRVSAFNFGLQKGILVGLGNGLNKEVKLVSPRIWKKYFNLSKDKKLSVDLVNNMYDLNIDYKYDGIAESILIASYFILNGGLDE